MRHRDVNRACAWSACLALGTPLFAHAHHAMDNATPGNLFEGLVSGLAHPVIGLDHLLFVIAIGVACYYFGRLLASTSAFLLGALLGTALHLRGAGLAYPEAWVALSLIFLGILLFFRSDLLKSKLAVAMFALTGVTHGYAYGESIVGAETTPLLAYLTGFTLVQILIVLSGYAIARYMDSKRASVQTLKATGGGLTGAGAAFLFLAFAV